jgi:hypothetical protein
MPRRLKPEAFCILFGTSELVPFQGFDFFSSLEIRKAALAGGFSNCA